MTTSVEPRAGSPLLSWIGLVLYVATGVFPYLASGLVAPLWGIALLWAGWVVGLAVTIGLVRKRSPWTLAMPVLALAFWWLVLTVGESVFGWTA